MALLAVAVVLAFNRQPLFIVGVLFVVVVPFERRFPRHRQPVRRPQIGTDIAYALVSGPLGLAGVTVGLALVLVTFAWLPGLVLRPVVLALPPGPRALVGFVLFDLAVYWAHRFGHEVPFLWRFHRIHHSTEHLDWISGFRAHPFDGVFLAPAFAILVTAGFSAKASGALAAAQVLSGLFLHANVDWRWRPLQRVVATPEFHHWHHSNEPDAHCSNYAAFLPAWDLIFGTYFMPDRRPARYGVDGPVPATLVGQLWEPLRGLRNPFPRLLHPRQGVGEIRTMLHRGRGQLLQATRRRVRPVTAPGRP